MNQDVRLIGGWAAGRTVNCDVDVGYIEIAEWTPTDKMNWSRASSPIRKTEYKLIPFYYGYDTRWFGVARGHSPLSILDTLWVGYVDLMK